MRSIFGALVFGLGISASVNAATIAWQTPGQISGDSDVSNVGTGAVGYNFNGNATTVNGVNFLAVPRDSGNTTATSSDGKVILTSAQAGTLGAYNGFAPAAGGSFSANYTDVLTNEIYNEASAQSVPFSIAISGLTPSQQYQVQYFVNDSRTCCEFRSVQLAGSPTATLDYNTTDADGGHGQYVIGTFTADATSQTISATGLPQAGGSTQVAAITLQAIPEPTFLGLACGAIGLLSTRRRIRR